MDTNKWTPFQTVGPGGIPRWYGLLGEGIKIALHDYNTSGAKPKAIAVFQEEVIERDTVALFGQNGEM